MKCKKWLAALCTAAMLAAGTGCQQQEETFADTITVSEDKDVQDNNSTDNHLSADKLADKVEEIYTTEYSEKIHDNIEDLKSQDDYDESNMLIIHNPYGTNTLSLYVYFKTDKAVKTSYTVSAEGYEDYSSQAESKRTKTHEFTVIGLVPNTKNTITFTMTDANGNTKTEKVTYKMGKLLGSEETTLATTDGTSTQALSNGLYTILGNDSDGQDFMYYYDNSGTIRGEVPILGYRSHRILFKGNLIYYSIGKHTLAAVDNLGQVQKVIHTGKYELHHDYCFDDDGNLVVLASYQTDDVDKCKAEDLIIRIDPDTDKILDVVDLGDILGDYKETTTMPESGVNGEGVYGLDWIHVNSIQWLGSGTVILSSRETSSIIKISKLFSKSPNLDYIIGQKDFWTESGYDDKVLTQVGTFSNTGGQHSVTYVPTDEDGVYYLYLFNNNYGQSTTQPDYDWTQISGIETKTVSAMSAEELAAANSYYYRYKVDENAGTYELETSFAVPYSSFVSSVQETGSTVIADSGFQGIFGEYTNDGQLIRQFKMKLSKYMIYRVYKYDFESFYQK